MQFFLDTANIDEIKECEELGLLDGITTNPSLITKVLTKKTEIYDRYKEICNICKGKPVSCEVFSDKYEDMLAEAQDLLQIADNVCVKLPITLDGLKVCRKITEQGRMTNMTLCFTPMQAVMCAKVGATFVSPFIGRLDDIGNQGLELIAKIRQIFNHYAFDTMMLSASIRSTLHVEQVAEIGSDVATMPFKVIKQLVKHPLTDAGMKIFEEDLKKLK